MLPSILSSNESTGWLLVLLIYKNSFDITLLSFLAFSRVNQLCRKVQVASEAKEYDML